MDDRICGVLWGKLEYFGFCATRVDDITKIIFASAVAIRGAGRYIRTDPINGAALRLPQTPFLSRNQEREEKI